MTFGKKLRTLRKQAELTQKELAQKLGVSRQAVTKWERGAGLPDVDNLPKIAALFGISVDELLDYKIESIDFVSDTTVEEVNKEDIRFWKVHNFILQKFPDADVIYHLSQELHLSIFQEIFYALFDIDIVLGLHELLQNGLVYSYYIEEDNQPYLVIVKKSTLLTKRLPEKFTKRLLVIDGYRYEKLKKLQ